MTNFLDRIRKPTGGSPNGPQAEPERAHPVELEPEAPKPLKTPVFSAEPEDIPDALGIAPVIGSLVELAAHAQTQTPLALGIFGPAGAGKSFAVNRLVADLRKLVAAAAGRESSPFVGRMIAAKVDAAAQTSPSISIASALYEALHAASPHRSAFATWAEDAAYNSGDPQQVVREANDRVSDLRRRHDSEKEALQEIRNRRARLTENVLYDSAGTRIDSYARNNRAGIESRLTGFGFTGSDPIATYKDLVRDYAEHSGLLRQIRVFLHSLWAYSGQMRLVILALLFVAFAWLMAQAGQPQAGWLANALANLQDRFAAFQPTADWIRGNAALFGLIKNASLWAAAGAIAINILRALRFFMPIRRGVALLNADVESRMRELDGLIATQGQHVDDLGKEIEKQSGLLAEAERRADAARHGTGVTTRAPFGATSEGAEGHARMFLQAMAADLGRKDSAIAPLRVLIAIDNLDALPPGKAADFIQQSQSLLAGTGFVCAIAIDLQHLKTGLRAQAGAEIAPEQISASIARLVQVPLRLDNRQGDDFSGLVKTLLDERKAEKVVPSDTSYSSLDEPMRPGEPELLTALSPLAGSTPREIKRFINTYRLIRPRTALFAPLALALAVQSGATPDERREFEMMLAGGGDAPLTASANSPRLATAIRAASTAQTSPITSDAVREAHSFAALHSSRF